jgi:hypothetical protein
MQKRKVRCLPGGGAVAVEDVEVLAAEQLAAVDAGLDGPEAPEDAHLLDVADERDDVQPLEFGVDGVEAADEVLEEQLERLRQTQHGLAGDDEGGHLLAAVVHQLALVGRGVVAGDGGRTVVGGALESGGGRGGRMVVAQLGRQAGQRTHGRHEQRRGRVVVAAEVVRPPHHPHRGGHRRAEGAVAGGRRAVARGRHVHAAGRRGGRRRLRRHHGRLRRRHLLGRRRRAAVTARRVHDRVHAHCSAGEELRHCVVHATMLLLLVRQ